MAKTILVLARSAALACVLAVALVACGSKAKKTTTTPDKTGTEMQTGSDGNGSTGGATYGGANAKPPASAGGMSGGADPCAGGK